MPPKRRRPAAASLLPPLDTDAARYRWLLDQFQPHDGKEGTYRWMLPILLLGRAATFDEAVDQAYQEQEQQRRERGLPLWVGDDPH